MKEKGIILQISTGGYAEHRVSYEAIEERLTGLLGRIPVEAVIIGWSCDRALYRQVIELLKGRGVKCYLWLPVFSETGVLDSRVRRLITEQGTEAECYSLAEGENFEFYCPNQPVNWAAFIELYEKFFDGLGFDGVFLDKIRYGTFANGIGGVFSCFCSRCMEEYKKAGLDTDGLKTEMAKMRSKSGAYSRRPMGIQSYQKGRYRFDNPVWEAFFTAKAVCVTEALEKITAYFHNRGMAVGMDVFAPFLGYFAGQDVEKLSELADFVKPMMYRITQAPAGLPFETDCLIRETAGKGTAEEAVKAGFLEAIGCGREDLGRFDREFVKRELLFMAELSSPVYCGIEVNQNHVAPAGPDYVKENLEAFSELPIHGYVLSWDLLSAPEENIEVIAGYFGKGR